jgi:anti-anti-sigma factor
MVSGQATFRLVAAEVFRIQPLAPRVYALVGEFDLEGADTFAEAVQVDAAEPGDIVLNLEELTFVGSMGIAALLRLASQLQGELILANPTDRVGRILHLVGIEKAPNIRIAGAGYSTHEALGAS